MNSCAVIIVNYNTGNLLARVVEQVISADNVDEIIIVDNNSSDKSMELIPKSVQIKTYYRKNNQGFANACNYGAQNSQSEYLLFLNPDCLIERDTITKALESFVFSTSAAIIGVQVNNPDGSEQRASRRRLPTLVRAIKSYTGLEKLAKCCGFFAGVNLHHQPMPETIQKVEAISGAFIIIKKIVFNEVHGFDEMFFLHFEDLDLFKKTIDAGYEILFNPNIRVIHYQGTSSQNNSQVGKYKKQSLQKYFHKHCSLFSYYVIKSISGLLR